MDSPARPSDRRLRALALLLATLGLVPQFGCSHNNAINFATSTQFGVKVGVNADKIPEVEIGYNRQEAARVPVYLEQDGKPAKSTLSTPEIHVLLKQANELLKSNEEASRQRGITILTSLKNRVEKGIGTNLVYSLLFEAASTTTASDPNSTKGLQDYIAATVALPGETRQFFEQGKFIGKREGERYEDAYSVLGTFSGLASGASSNAPNAKLKVSQFFATGIAAQELARYGGAATINPGAQPPTTLSATERAKEREIGRQQVEQANALDAVSTKIWSAKDPKQRERLAKSALDQVPLPDDADIESEAAKIARQGSERALRNYLRAAYLEYTPKMLSNLNQQSNP